jgi:hypothetical protein
MPYSTVIGLSAPAAPPFQISTMNRIFGSSSSSKKPKPTLQDVIDQVGVAVPERAPIVFIDA